MRLLLIGCMVISAMARDASFGEKGRELPGTLTLPAGQGPFPALILVHGSGPGDRDETVGPNKPFRDLSEGLNERGIAVFRYDKRTRVHPHSPCAQLMTRSSGMPAMLCALRPHNPASTRSGCTCWGTALVAPPFRVSRKSVWRKSRAWLSRQGR